MGGCSAIITAVALIILAIWQSGQYNDVAQDEVQQLMNTSLDNIIQGAYNLARTENEAVQQLVDNKLSVARHLLKDAVAVGGSEYKINWTAVNQFTKEHKTVSVPKFFIEGIWLIGNITQGIEPLVVNDLTRLLGENFIIFQCMNEKGDMLCVATSGMTGAGKRAIGTYIPAVNADGTDNPVISTVIRGETYHGPAYIVNGWYIAACEPLKSREGNLMGMICVGADQKAVESRVRQSILQTRVGKTGYVYVLAGRGSERGRYIISYKGQRDGEDIWLSQDSYDHYVIQQIVNKATALGPGEMTTIRYAWQNPGETEPRWKVVRLAYYKPWNWVIGSGVYEDELQIHHTILSEGRSRMVQVMAMAGILIIILEGILGTLITWTITRPVRQITRVAEKITGGDMNQVVKMDSHDEIGILAHTFNLMMSKLKQTMEGLSKNEERYRGIFENALEGLFHTELDNTDINVNPAMANMLGYDSPENLITSITDIRNQLFVNPQKYDVMVNTVLEHGEISKSEVQLYRKDGSKTWISVSARLFYEDSGKPVYVEGFLSDVSARKQAEEALAESRNYLNEIINTVADPMFVKDSQHKWMLVNNAMCTFVGYTREELLGKSDYDFSSREEGDVFWEQDRLVLNSGKESINEETFTNYRRIVHTLATKRALYINRRGEKFIVGIARDITDQKRAEEEREQLEARLNQAEKMEAIGTLAGGIAHDFNNILSVIIGYTELAMDNLSQQDKVICKLKEVLKAGERARDLVKQILTFSRMNGSEYAPFEMRSIVKESLKMLRSVIPSTIEIHQNLAVPGLIMSCPTQINQIMINLCTNAAQAMDETGGIVDVSLEDITQDDVMHSSQGTDLPPGEYVRLTVSDTGKGISPEIMDRIYEPYFTTKEQGRGTGLGLAVVHGIVKSHHGTITCKSSPMEGTTFEVYLPRFMKEWTNGEQTEDRTLTNGKENILLVDDEQALVDMSVEMLNSRGYKVTSRTSGIDALNLFRENPQEFDLVITDMTMPGLTGDRLAQELIAIRSDIPIILCTGYNEHISEEKAKDLGIREFMLKPLNMRTLATTIRKVLDG